MVKMPDPFISQLSVSHQPSIWLTQGQFLIYSEISIVLQAPIRIKGDLLLFA